MTDDLYSALEVCLQALEQGADLESCLALFPALADELRPVLETAVQAQAAAVRDVPPATMRRGRARVLQHAAELRESRRSAAVLPFWRRARIFRWAITTLTTVVFLLSGGTGLVFASSGSLPGDNLYPVKRSWEGLQLFFVFDPTAHTEMEDRFEQERVQEIHELFSESRKTQVDFQGVVEKQQPGVWQIAGLQIAIDEEATFNGQIIPGSLVEVIGETEDGIIKAEQINLILAPSRTLTPVPTLRPQPSSTAAPVASEDAGHGDESETPSIEDKETQETEKTGTSGGGSQGSSETPQADDHSGSGGGGDGSGDDH